MPVTVLPMSDISDYARKLSARRRYRQCEVSCFNPGPGQ